MRLGCVYVRVFNPYEEMYLCRGLQGAGMRVTQPDKMQFLPVSPMRDLLHTEREENVRDK